MMRVQIWRTDWVPVLADAPQPGLRVKIWGRGFGPHLADVQINISVAPDILKYDSRIFPDPKDYHQRLTDTAGYMCRGP